MSLRVSVCFTYLLFDIIIFVFDLFILHYTCISLYFFVNIACPSLVHAIHLIDLLHNTHVVNAKQRAMNGMPCILRKDAMHSFNSML